LSSTSKEKLRSTLQGVSFDGEGVFDNNHKKEKMKKNK